MVKSLLAMQETWVWSLGQEDPLEKGMLTHSSIFAWRIPWTEEPGRLLIVQGVAKSQTQLSDFHSLTHIILYILYRDLYTKYIIVWIYSTKYIIESWTTKKAESQRIDGELRCWRRLLRVPWIVRRSNQSILKKINWIFIGRTDAEAEVPILWPPDAKSQLIGKDSDAGKDWGQEEKGVTKNTMVGWHYWLDGYEFEQTPGNSEEQGSML